MPPSALEHLTRLNIRFPMLFKLSNEKTNRITHCGVLEFVADEGRVYLPCWVIFNFNSSILSILLLIVDIIYIVKFNMLL